MDSIIYYMMMDQESGGKNHPPFDPIRHIWNRKSAIPIAVGTLMLIFGPGILDKIRGFHQHEIHQILSTKAPKIPAFGTVNNGPKIPTDSTVIK